MESPLLSLPVRDATRRRQPQRRQSDSTRQGAEDGVSPPLAPSQGCEQETMAAETAERRHEAGHWGWSLPSSRSQSGMRAGDDDGGTMRVRGEEQIRSVLSRADPEQGPP